MGGIFRNRSFSKGIYTTLILENEKHEKQKNLKTMKYLQQFKYRPRNFVGVLRFPMIKKIIVFRKSDVGILKVIFDGTLVNTKINPDTFECLLSAKIDVD